MAGISTSSQVRIVSDGDRDLLSVLQILAEYGFPMKVFTYQMG
ncbi:hypothetical protein [Paenibacillus sp. JJ-100]|nr:hypothetical protein [Paenibacillus sp. JJ-100]